MNSLSSSEMVKGIKTTISKLDQMLLKLMGRPGWLAKLNPFTNFQSRSSLVSQRALELLHELLDQLSKLDCAKIDESGVPESTVYDMTAKLNRLIDSMEENLSMYRDIGMTSPLSRRFLTSICSRSLLDFPKISKQAEDLMNAVVEELKEASWTVSRVNMYLDISTDADRFEPCFNIPELPTATTTQHANFLSEFQDTDQEQYHPAFTEVQSMTQEALVEALCGISGREKSISDRSEKAVSSRVPVVALVGENNSGKTEVLLSLIHKESVSQRFPHGIYVLFIENSVSKEKRIEALSHVVRCSGGANLARHMETLSSLNDVSKQAAKWFRGRTAMFVCCGIRTTSTNPASAIDFVVGALSLAAPSSAMLFSTDDQLIAESSAAVTVFHMWGIMRPLQQKRALLQDMGESSIKRVSSTGKLTGALPADVHEDSLGHVISLCAGNPFLLSICGLTLRTLHKRLGYWDAAFSHFLQDQNHHGFVQPMEMKMRDASSSALPILLVAIRVVSRETSIELERDDISFMTLFLRLCILRKQSVVPRGFLDKIWTELSCDEVSGFICILKKHKFLNSVNGPRMAGSVSVNEIVFDFIQTRAHVENIFLSAHKEVIQSFSSQLLPSENQVGIDWARCYEVIETQSTESQEGFQPLLQWWSLEKSDVNDFFLDNLIRLMATTGKLPSIVGLLCNARWSLKRLCSSGAPSLLDDFDYILSPQNVSAFSKSARKSLQILRCALSDMSRFVLKDEKLLISQTFGRLLGIEDEIGILKAFQASAEDLVDDLWLRPTTRHWPGPFGDSLFEIDTILAHADLVRVDWDRKIAYVARKFGLPARVLKLDLQSRQAVASHPQPNRCFSISRDGKILAFDTERLRLSATHFGTTKPLWTNDDFRLNRITAAAWSDDGSIAVLAGEHSYGSDWPTGHSWVESVEGFSGLGMLALPNAHGCHVSIVRACADGATLASASIDGVAKLWCSSTGILLLRLDVNGTISAMALRSRRLALAFGDGESKIKVTGENEEVCDISCPHSIRAIAFGGDTGNLVYGDNTGFVEMMEMRNMKRLFRVELGAGLCANESFDVSTDGEKIMAACLDGIPRVLDTKNLTLLVSHPKPRRHRSAILSMCYEGDTLTTVSRTELMTWSSRSENSEIHREFPNGEQELVALVPSTNGVVFVSDCRIVEKWRNGNLGITLVSTLFADKAELSDELNSERCITAIDVSESGRVLAVLSSDGVLRLVETEGTWVWSKVVSNSLDVHPYMAVSKNGASVAVSSGKHIWFWSVVSDGYGAVKEAQKFDSWRDHTISALALSHDGRILCVGDVNGGVALWKVGSKDEHWIELGSHPQTVRCIHVGQEEKLIVSCCAMKQVRVWDIPTASYLLATLPGMAMEIAIGGINEEFISIGDEGGRVATFQLMHGSN